jgi:hypothetical protein
LASKDRKRIWPIYYDRKKETATPKNTSKSKKNRSGLLLLLLLLLLYTFFKWSKASKLNEKSKRKKKGVRIQAIIGRIRTLDPDPGHFGPDFDSGSVLESAFRDSSPVRP